MKTFPGTCGTEEEEQMRRCRISRCLIMAFLVIFTVSIAISPVMGDQQDQMSIYQTSDGTHPLDAEKLLEERDALVKEYKKSKSVSGEEIGLGDPKFIFWNDGK